MALALVNCCPWVRPYDVEAPLAASVENRVANVLVVLVVQVAVVADVEAETLFLLVVAYLVESLAVEMVAEA